MADPLDILPLAELKTALRIVGDNTDHDDLLSGHIKGAATWIEEVTGLQLTSDDYAVADVPGAIKSAIVLLARAMYDLDPNVSSNSAVNMLIAPYRKF